MKKSLLAILAIAFLSCEPEAHNFCGTLENGPTKAVIPNHPEITNYYFVTISSVDYYIPDGPEIQNVIKNNKRGDRICLETAGIKKLNKFGEVYQ